MDGERRQRHRHRVHVQAHERGARDAQTPRYDLCWLARPDAAAAAVPDERRTQIIQLLEHGATRDELRQRIARDVCLRSNPKPLGDEAIDVFLDRTIAEVQFA